MATNKDLQDIANILRRDSLIMTTSAKSGHPTSCLSCAEIMSVLFFNEMSYDKKNPHNPDNDEFILSKAHAAPILYSALSKANCIRSDLKDLRKINSPLEGHPIPNSLKWIKVATGSLGQGLSIGVGMALAAKLQKRKFKTYVLMGDSELTEGSIYEALQLADYYKLNNLCAVVDVNGLGQSRETIFRHDLESYEKRFSGFNWNVISVNGENTNELKDAFTQFKKSNKPTIILAKTLKGSGVSFIENKENWHGKALNDEELKIALEEIPDSKMPAIKIDKPKKVNYNFEKQKKVNYTNYNFAEPVSTRVAYGNALVNLAKSSEEIIVLDAEVSNSTYTQKVKKALPNQYIEGFIAEQNLIGMALGLSVKGFNTFSSSFASFLSRAHDQIRMSAISRGNLTICGSHCGVSIGSDGASQMGLEDISMFRALPNSTVFYPSDAVSMEKLTILSSKLNGIKYIRSTREKTPVIYNSNEEFSLGEFKVLKETSHDKCVIVGSGITLHEALNAYEELKKQKINCAVIDLYCIKPFNSKKFINFVEKHGKKIIISEDHRPEGGIGEMISKEITETNIKLIHLSINEIPHSGSPRELLEKYGIDSGAIIKSVKEII